ncbi:MAG: hypothetical protein [Caudoviricetes sp.]|nr:MAG: hypothetical protein [Caudoviricetes sp.]
MAKYEVLASSALDYGTKKRTREEVLANDKKFTDKIAAMPMMTDKNVNEILEADYKWFMDQLRKKEELVKAYKDGKLRSDRLIKEAKTLLKRGVKVATA